VFGGEGDSGGGERGECGSRSGTTFALVVVVVVVLLVFGHRKNKGLLKMLEVRMLQRDVGWRSEAERGRCWNIVVPGGWVSG